MFLLQLLALWMSTTTNDSRTEDDGDTGSEPVVAPTEATEDGGATVPVVAPTEAPVVTTEGATTEDEAEESGVNVNNDQENDTGSGALQSELRKEDGKRPGAGRPNTSKQGKQASTSGTPDETVTPVSPDVDTSGHETDASAVQRKRGPKFLQRQQRAVAS